MLAYDSTLKVPLVLSGAAVRDARRDVARVAHRSRADAVASWPASPTAGPSADLLAPQLAERDVYAETQYPRVGGMACALGAGGGAMEAHSVVRDRALRLVDRSGRAEERCRGARGGRARHDDAPDGAPVGVAGASRGGGGGGERAAARAWLCERAAAPAGIDPRAPNPARVIDAWAAFETALAQVNRGPRAGRAAVAEGSRGRSFPTRPCSRRRMDARSRMRGVPRTPSRCTGRRCRAFATRASITTWRLRRGRPATCRKPSRPSRRRWRSRDAIPRRSTASVSCTRRRDAPTEAAASFEQAATLDPSNASYWTNLGNARRELSQLPQAEAAYRRALDADSTYADAANGLGTILVQTGKPADAVTWFERALQQRARTSTKRA